MEDNTDQDALLAAKLFDGLMRAEAKSIQEVTDITLNAAARVNLNPLCFLYGMSFLKYLLAQVNDTNPAVVDLIDSAAKMAVEQMKDKVAETKALYYATTEGKPN